MGKHEAQGRAASKVTIVIRKARSIEAIRQAEKAVVKHFVHFVVICFHTTAAVIVIEKTPVLLLLGLVH